MSKLAARDQVEADMAAEREALLQVPSGNHSFTQSPLLLAAICIFFAS